MLVNKCRCNFCDWEGEYEDVKREISHDGSFTLFINRCPECGHKGVEILGEMEEDNVC